MAYSASQPTIADRQAQPKTPPPRQIPVRTSSPQARRTRIVTPSSPVRSALLRPDLNVSSVTS